jgi:hypothetical protein
VVEHLVLIIEMAIPKLRHGSYFPSPLERRRSLGRDGSGSSTGTR